MILTSEQFYLRSSCSSAARVCAAPNSVRDASAREQGSREAAPIDLYRDASPIDLYWDAAPIDLCKDAAPIDLYRDAAPTDLCRDATPTDLYRHAAPTDLHRDPVHDAPSETHASLSLLTRAVQNVFKCEARSAANFSESQIWTQLHVKTPHM